MCALAVSQQAAITAPTGAFSSSFATGSLSATPGSYTITYSYAGDNNFNGAGPDTSKALTVQKATPVFSNLVGPTITFVFFKDTPTAEICTLSLHHALPVSITLNGVTQQAAITATTGAFSSSFATGS